jgi:hypothetical protein
VVLAVGLATVGLALGLGCGALTTVRREGADVVAWATIPAAALWVVGMGSRLGFGIVALNGGAQAIGRLSERLHVHSAGTWPTALILMALSEVLSRTTLLLWKYRTASRRPIAAVRAMAPSVG